MQETSLGGPDTDRDPFALVDVLTAATRYDLVLAIVDAVFLHPTVDQDQDQVDRSSSAQQPHDRNRPT